jgi:predicted TPR repeat methyltransferase
MPSRSNNCRRAKVIYSELDSCNMNEFDIKAREWDNNQLHLERSAAIAAAIAAAVPLERSRKAMEFGAGTALLSFELKDKLQDITLMDSSTEMVRIMNEKISEENIHNMHPVLLDLEKQYYSGRFDLIYSQMVFHHIEDIGNVLGKFNRMLQSGGFLAIADLYLEDGSFHGNVFHGHKGFDTQKLERLLREHGFRDVKTKHCFTIHKFIQAKVKKEFPVFLMTGVKRN